MNKRDLLIILAVVLLLRLPFLNEAVQGDESTFLASAAHAQIDPLHPNHVRYVFTPFGEEVNLEGGSHMPLDAWVLAGLIAIFGDVREVLFHAVYILFSLLAALAMYSLARRFSPQPLWATLLFLAVPAFVVNGDSLEADVPHAALFLCGIAAFVAATDRRSGAWLSVAALFLACAALTAMQAQVVIPILLAYVWLEARDWVPGWIAAFTPFLALAAWEAFERITTGAFPFLLTAGYMHQQQLGTANQRLTNTAGLLIQLCFIVFPPLFVWGLWAAWRRRHDRDTAFLAAWIGIYLAAACALFEAGSARYLLPIAAPVAIWASFARRSWVVCGFAVQMALAVCLAIANYQHWSAYREFAQELVPQTDGHRVWINSEWGLRHYMEDAGARVAKPGQAIPSGDIVVWSELVQPVALTHPQELSASVLERDVRPPMPFRIIGLESSSGFSSIHRGFLPFGVGLDLVDRIHADIYKEAKATLSDLPMDAPEADAQIVSGIYELDGDHRWTAGTATVVLVSPADAEPLHARFFVPDNAAAREMTILLDNTKVYSHAFGPGMQRIVTSPEKANGATSTVTLQVDRTFSAPGDSRVLGVSLMDVGWGK